MEARATDENSTTLDSILTLIDTISSRLVSLSQDYRGSEDLKLELKVLNNLLQSVSCLRKDQSSILFLFSEELRHFYLLLRSERKLENVFVEEITRFRESVRSFQCQFCELNTSILDAVFHRLEQLVPESNLASPQSFPDAFSDEYTPLPPVNLKKLKVELKLIKLFYLYAINSRMNCQASHEFSLSKIQSAIYQEAAQFYCHLLTFKHSSISHELDQASCSFRESLLNCCKQHISEFYTRMLELDPSLQSSNTSPWPFCQLFEYFDCLLESLIYSDSSSGRIGLLIQRIRNIMTFLTNFFRFATLIGNETPWIGERFLIHCQSLAINAASIGYLCWFHGDDDQVFDELQSRSCELVEKIWPVNNAQVAQNYIDALTTSRKSRSSSSSLFSFVGRDREMVADFLLDCVFEFLYGGTSFSVSIQYQLKVFAMKLDHIRKIMRRYHKNIDDELRQGSSLTDAVYEAAIIIFQLHHMLREKDGLAAKELEDRISQLLGKMCTSPTGIEEAAAAAGEEPSWPSTPHLVINGRVVGGYGGVGTEEIKEQLLRRSGESKVVAIVGQARLGFGGTTLAGKVYNDPEVIGHFDIRAWCSLFHPRRGNMEIMIMKSMLPRKNVYREMMIEILNCILPRDSYDYTAMSYRDLGRVVYESLKGKRYLIVLRAYKTNWHIRHPWEDLGRLFPNDDAIANQSKLLFTCPSYRQGMFDLFESSSTSNSRSR